MIECLAMFGGLVIALLALIGLAWVFDCIGKAILPEDESEEP